MMNADAEQNGVLLEPQVNPPEHITEPRRLLEVLLFPHQVHAPTVLDGSKGTSTGPEARMNTPAIKHPVARRINRLCAAGRRRASHAASARIPNIAR